MAAIELKFKKDTIGIIQSVLVNGIMKNIKDTVLGRTSISRYAKSNYFTLPLYAGDDILREVVLDISKSLQIKLAYDIKIILERELVDDPRNNLKVNSLMALLPFKKLERSGSVAIESVFDSASNEIISIGENYEIAKECMSEVWDLVTDKKELEIGKNNNYETGGMIGEAQSMVIQERAGALPTRVAVNINYFKANDEVKKLEQMFAVEAIPRVVDATELRIKLAGFEGNSFAKRYVKFLNREKAFWKDLILDMENIKDAAKNKIKGGDYAIVDSLRKLKGATVGGVKPFTGIIISKNSADKMLEEERIDVYEMADKIMKGFFAVALFIYDAEMDTIDVIYDGEKKFAKYPFSTFVGEVSKYERQLNQMIRLGGGM